MDAESYAFCRLLAYTGCRISEGLELKPERLDAENKSVVFRTLKRRRLIFRAVPIPAALMRDLGRLARDKHPDAPMWSWSRPTAWRRICWAMAEAGISGPHAVPKGLRHGFGVVNAEKNVPMGLTREWMGHADIATTAIYQHAMGNEERSFAKRIWREFGVEE